MVTGTAELMPALAGACAWLQGEQVEGECLVVGGA